MKKILFTLAVAMLSASLLADENPVATPMSQNAESGETGKTVRVDSVAKRTEVVINTLKMTDGPVEVYNLCGKFVANDIASLKKGVYIVKQNGTSRKMVVR